MNVDKELTANQKKFLDKIEADYILLKFGSYGQAYASAVADRNPRLYKKMLSKPNYRQFIADKEKKDFIIEKTQALCTEMEGAAIAQTAYRNGVPFVILRAISDKADNSAEMDYPTFETLSAHRCAEVTHRLARTLLEAESA